MFGSLMVHLAGGDTLSGMTLGRAFSMHVVFLPWVLFFILALHLRLVQRHGIAPTTAPAPAPAPGGQSRRLLVLRESATEADAESLLALARAGNARATVLETGGARMLDVAGAEAAVDRLARESAVVEAIPVDSRPQTTTAFQRQFLRRLGANLLIAGVLVLLAAWLPPRISGPVDPLVVEPPGNTPWYVLWYAGLVRMFSPGLAFLAPVVLFLMPALALLWPVIDVYDGDRPRRPKLTPIAGVAFVGILAALSIYGAAGS
jgi:quinol-cytochrome oxidoreductase complex cytochrome b subunit